MLIKFLFSPELAVRIFRPHLATDDLSSIENIDELGLRSFPAPFSSWTLFKQHRWMILTTKFVSFLRTDITALNFLSLLEYSWFPAETYFISGIQRKFNFLFVYLTILFQ